MNKTILEKVWYMLVNAGISKSFGMAPRILTGRSPDICMNIIQNSLGTMSHGVKFHLGLPIMQCSQKFNLQVLAPFNKPYFARACKDFSPVCPSLICQGWVQSLYKFVESLLAL